MRFRNRRARLCWQIRAWVGHVHLKTLNQRAETCDCFAFACFFHLRDDVWRQLKVPSVIEFACLKNRTTRTIRVAATFEVHFRERRLCRVTVVRVRGHLDHVVWTEIVNHEGTCADWAKVCLCAFWCFCSKAICELCRLDDRGLTANEGAIWVWLRLAEGDFDSQIINRFYAFNAVKERQLRASAFWVHTIFGGELHVRGGERRAIRPQQARSDFPRDLCQILGNAAIGNCWDF